jgi:HD-like signal output (HDOD) protein
MPALKSLERRLLGRLPAFSPIAVRLLAALADERTSFKEIARLITLDPIQAAEVLRLANSGLYGRRVEVRSVLHAIAMLGFGKLSQIAVTAALWRGVPTRTAPFVREWWRHNIAAALIAKECGRGRSVDSAYTAALLHGVGQLALFEDSPEQYPALVESAYLDEGDLLARERGLFGVDHEALAGLFLESWGLPASLCAAVKNHHAGRTEDRLTVAVQAGCLGAEYAGFGRCGCQDQLAAGLPESLTQLLSDEFSFDLLVASVNRIECSLGL